MLDELVKAHRKRGALVALDDMSGGAESLQFLELLRPDVVKIDNALTAGIQHSPARRRLVAALVDCAHEHGCKVVAEGVERVDEFQAMADLGVDLGQGFYFGQPTEKPMAVDTRLVRARAPSSSELLFERPRSVVRRHVPRSGDSQARARVLGQDVRWVRLNERSSADSARDVPASAPISAPAGLR